MKKILVFTAAAAAMMLSGAAASAEATYGDIECSLSDQGYLSAENHSGGADAAYVAAYSDGHLVDVQMPQIQNDSFSAVINDIDSVDTVKVFFWENAENMRPVSAYTFDLDQDWTANNNEAMAVSETAVETDKDGNDIAVIRGYSGGCEVEYRTTPISAAYEIGVNMFSGKNYDVSLIWDPTQSENDTAQKLAGDIEAGDILLVDTDTEGNIKDIIRMVKAEQLRIDGRLEWGQDMWHRVSEAREGWIGGDVESVTVDHNNNALIKFNEDNTFALDADEQIDVIEIGADGVSLSDTITAEELITEGEGGDHADILVMKTYRADITHAFVYRFAF